jgi:hypothetical protein
MDEAGVGRILSDSHGPTAPVVRLGRTTGRRSSARGPVAASVDDVRQGVHDLQPLLERMVGTSKDHYLGKARMMLDLAF